MTGTRNWATMFADARASAPWHPDADLHTQEGTTLDFPRSAGVLLHPTSFPGRYGIGDLGEHAYRFLDFLAESKQSLWQILPLGPTGYGDSPYQSFSAFAGNPLLISPDRLVADGYLPAEAVAE